jgi:hypothetical protein
MKCPTCRRQYDGQASTCSRCQTDLTELAAIEAAGQAFLARADLLMRSGDLPAAEVALGHATKLLGDTPDLAQRRATCHLLAHRFPEAFVAWLRHPDWPRPI